jgi:hypothetical protein
MKKFFTYLFFTGALLFQVLVATAGTIENIATAIQSGNAKELAKFFDNNVDITVYNKEEMYSKTQAEMVVRDFFSKNTPTSFKIIHKGTSNQGSEYAIGTLITSVGSFRTYIYVKQKSTGYTIQEIRFEKD